MNGRRTGRFGRAIGPGLLILLGACATAAPGQREPALADMPARITDAPPLAGRATVVDGDTLTIATARGAVRVRLHAVDAPEMAQTCEGRAANGRPALPIACGAMARSALVGLIGDGEVRCAPRDRDRYGRVVAMCMADGRDLGRELVQLGWARAYTRYGRDYAADEEAARAARRGFWGGEWQAPADWRRER